MSAGARASLDVDPDDNAFVYVYDGRVALGDGSTAGSELGAGQLAVLRDGDTVVATTRDSSARFLLLAARPLSEPVARYGPFVMNTREELVQAAEDYRSGRLLG